MIPDPAPPFEVDASGVIRDRIRGMLRRAAELGVLSEISRPLTEILCRLTNDPRDWGDPLWHYRSLQMLQYGGTLDNFGCEYSVHDRVPTVVITRLFPLPGAPLYGEDIGG